MGVGVGGVGVGVPPPVPFKTDTWTLSKGFVQNIAATGLAHGRTPLIGVIAPSLTWPAVPEIMHGVSAYIENTPYEMVLYCINFERNHSDVIDRILSMRIAAGLLAILPGQLTPHLTQFFEQGLPLVLIDDQEEPTTIPWVGIDNFSAAYAATHHFLEQGHGHIAHVMGPQNYYCALQRYKGYRQALQDSAIPFDPELVLQGTFTPMSGHICAETLFQRERSTWPSAIFVGNDQMAYGI